MQFEYDLNKSEANKVKHGIDFKEAQQLWENETVEAITRSDTEPRSLVIGRIGRKHWTAIITRRKSLIRIISVRRSRDKEIDAYENR